MRLLGVLRDTQTLQRIVQVMGKANKTCVVRVTPKDFQLMIHEDGEQMTVWAGMAMNVLFESFEVQSTNNNNIGFTLQLDQLERALKSMQASPRTTVRLVKKNGLPLLAFGGVLTQGRNQIQTSLTQEVPLQIIAPHQLSVYVEPSAGSPDVYILLPPLSVLRGAVDRLKNISDTLTIWANMNGQMRFSVATDVCEVELEFAKLSHPTLNGPAPTDAADKQRDAQVTVDVKYFGKVMNVALLNSDVIILCLTNQGSCVVHTLARNSTDFWLTFHLPVLMT